MIINLRNQAEAFAIGLEIGATSVSDVVTWAEGVIEAQDKPHWSICELATMSTRHPQDVANALREVPGEFDSMWVQGELVRMLSRGLASDRTRADQIASALYDLAITDELPDEELCSLAWWAWDALSLADDGMIDKSREQIIDEMVDALQKAARNNSNNDVG